MKFYEKYRKSEDKYKDKDLEDDGDVTSEERATQLTVLL